MEAGEISGCGERLRAAISKQVGRFVLAKTVWRIFIPTIETVGGEICRVPVTQAGVCGHTNFRCGWRCDDAVVAINMMRRVWSGID